MFERERAALPPLLRSHLHAYEAAFEAKEWFASAVWAAVTLEALLDHVFVRMGVESKARELADQIARLRSLMPASGRTVPDEVAKRCEEIRMIRNRLVHHTGSAKESLEADAVSTQAHLKAILGWMASVGWLSDARNVEDSTTASQASPKGAVFLATITPHTAEQRFFIEEIKLALGERGLSVRMVELTEYDRNDPLGPVAVAIRECDAVLVVGLERSHAYFIRDKENSPHQGEDVHRRYSSSWLHLEAGLAYAFRKPVYVLCEEKITSDGIFDRKWNSYVAIEMPKLDVASRAVVETLDRLSNAISLSHTAARETFSRVTLESAKPDRSKG